MTKWMRAIATALMQRSWRDAGVDQTTMSPRSAAAVASVSVAPGDAVNTVQWSAVDSATSYNLYWSTHLRSRRVRR